MRKTSLIVSSPLLNTRNELQMKTRIVIHNGFQCHDVTFMMSVTREFFDSKIFFQQKDAGGEIAHFVHRLIKLELRCVISAADPGGGGGW